VKKENLKEKVNDFIGKKPNFVGNLKARGRSEKPKAKRQKNF
jgi:hypothetical protein